MTDIVVTASIDFYRKFPVVFLCKRRISLRFIIIIIIFARHQSLPIIMTARVVKLLVYTSKTNAFYYNTYIPRSCFSLSVVSQARQSFADVKVFRSAKFNPRRRRDGVLSRYNIPMYRHITLSSHPYNNNLTKPFGDFPPALRMIYEMNRKIRI